MSTEIFLQARMGSTRLPGKVLKQVLDKPLLAYQIERLKRVQGADAVVVLTSNLPLDDPIVELCKKLSISHYRGDAENVLKRFYDAAQQRQTETVVRICGDCPLIDPEIVDEAIKTFKSQQPQVAYVSNCLKRTYPRGQDVEVFSSNALKTAYEFAKSKTEQEHVTPYIYQHKDQFRLYNIVSAIDYSSQRWTVDTIEDFYLIKLILEALYPQNPTFTMDDVLNLLKKHPDWLLLNAEIKQKELSG